jgi:N-acetylglutamate synthase
MGDGVVLDELMADAWPAQEQQRHRRWRFRWTSGVTRRANSALAIGAEVGDELTVLVAAAEGFAADRGAPARFLVSTASAPPALDPLLAARGYTTSARTIVMTAAVDAVTAATAPGPWDLDVAARPSDAWFDVYWTAEAARTTDMDAARICRDVLLAPSLETVYVAASEGREVVAVGQLVIGDDVAVVQCMATAVACRRRGAASAVLRQLALEACRRGTSRLCLAVMADNAAARPLYERIGFTPSHEYHYRSGR